MSKCLTRETSVYPKVNSYQEKPIKLTTFQRMSLSLKWYFLFLNNAEDMGFLQECRAHILGGGNVEPRGDSRYAAPPKNDLVITFDCSDASSNLASAFRAGRIAILVFFGLIGTLYYNNIDTYESLWPVRLQSRSKGHPFGLRLQGWFIKCNTNGQEYILFFCWQALSPVQSMNLPDSLDALMRFCVLGNLRYQFSEETSGRTSLWFSARLPFLYDYRFTLILHNFDFYLCKLCLGSSYCRNEWVVRMLFHKFLHRHGPYFFWKVGDDLFPVFSILFEWRIKFLYWQNETNEWKGKKCNVLFRSISSSLSLLLVISMIRTDLELRRQRKCHVLA